MLLIDADALKQECMYIDDIPAVTERDIDNAPTIDAIPVEWLREKRVTHPTIDAEILHNSVIRAVLVMWEREQEAKEG